MLLFDKQLVSRVSIQAFYLVELWGVWYLQHLSLHNNNNNRRSFPHITRLFSFKYFSTMNVIESENFPPCESEKGEFITQLKLIQHYSLNVTRLFQQQQQHIIEQKHIWIRAQRMPSYFYIVYLLALVHVFHLPTTQQYMFFTYTWAPHEIFSPSPLSLPSNISTHLFHIYVKTVFFLFFFYYRCVCVCTAVVLFHNKGIPIISKRRI